MWYYGPQSPPLERLSDGNPSYNRNPLPTPSTGAGRPNDTRVLDTCKTGGVDGRFTLTDTTLLCRTLKWERRRVDCGVSELIRTGPRTGGRDKSLEGPVGLGLQHSCWRHRSSPGTYSRNVGGFSSRPKSRCTLGGVGMGALDGWRRRGDWETNGHTSLQVGL